MDSLSCPHSGQIYFFQPMGELKAEKFPKKCSDHGPKSALPPEIVELGEVCGQVLPETPAFLLKGEVSLPEPLKQHF